MQVTTTRSKITATADGEGVVSHAGSRLLADVADRTTLTGQLAEALAGLRGPRARHDPGRVLVDMAVAVADGATTISDVAVLADQAELFGSVASDSTCWRLLDRLDTVGLGAVGRARAAAAREVVWAQRAELSDGGHRDGASLAEITRILPARSLPGYPSGTRVIVRRERPHPGAQLDAFEEADGWRYTAFATDTRFGQLARLDARHRAHARVEDRIRTAKDTGLDHFPSGRSRSTPPGSASSCWRSI